MTETTPTACASGPLAGIRVVELAGIGPAPFCGMLLADLGADVVRVDRPTEFGNDGDVLNRGKRSIAVDLKHADGPDTVRGLAARADIFLEGLRPGVTERLGVGPEDCWRTNPRLVYGRMTGWGQDGPRSDRSGHDIDYIALSGMLHAIGRAGGSPQVPVNLLGDFGGGAMYLAVGVLAAVLEARTSGQGQVVDAAIVDGSAHLGTMLFGLLAAGSWSTERGTNLLDTGAPFYDVYETADGEHVAVGALEPQFYAELIDKLELNETAPSRDDPANWPEIRRQLSEAFRRHTRDEWEQVFVGSDACVAPVLSMSEAREHPHLASRETFTTHDGAVQPSPAPRFGRTANPSVRAAPTPGSNADEIARDWQLSDSRLLHSEAVVRKDI